MCCGLGYLGWERSNEDCGEVQWPSANGPGTMGTVHTRDLHMLGNNGRVLYRA